jgi:phosphoenolpyruvate carboxylase
MPKTSPPVVAKRKLSGALSEAERPLVDDIRWLGRLLGDVIREQEGDAAFALVEQIRRLSVAFAAMQMHWQAKP